MEKDGNLLEKIVSLAKRRGFIFQGSEIYGGLAGTWDYGPAGVLLKENIKRTWWRMFVDERDDMYGLDAAILMNARVWEASGHTGAGFTDPLSECRECKKRFRADHLSEENRKEKKCPSCGGGLSEERQFNLMFRTQVGAMEDSSALAYLRPETAQGIFVNFKNILDTMRPKIPFGIAQIGKAFRNEITPKDFIFRVREFEQMEIEYFVRENEWEKRFEEWRTEIWRFIDALGIPRESVSELDVPAADRAHYSKKTIDFEFAYPFGKDELVGFAYRTDHDLAAHAKHSGADLSYREGDEKFIPHVIEPSFGVERAVLAVLCSAYTEDEMGGEKRVYMKFAPSVAPIKAALFPLLRNKPELVEKARAVYVAVKKEIPHIMWDDNGNIGKRYRRQDEIGTPFCITVDFDTLTDGTVTVRDRDTGKQERVAAGDVSAFIKDRIAAQ